MIRSALALTLLGLTLLGLGLAAHAQYRPTPPSSVLLHDLRKLRSLRSALYVAAHPDDENTRLIAYLANDALAETAYLSLTRGDGGQNLIGPELREGLGVIRTQELLAARRTDGGSQFFSRANDFGFSKHPDETLTFWDRDSILSDMVWVIRKWRPDVIVTRFDPGSAGRTHGHHTTSAMLAVEAYDLAADAGAFPEQLRHGVEPWRAERLLFNTSWWFYGSREAFEAADKTGLFTVDAGAYYPLLGLSNGEIAAKSRSQHLSQGFGSGSSRGSQEEYLRLLAGEDADDRTDLFAGVDATWSRVPGGAAVAAALARAEADFDPADPSTAVPELLEAQRLLGALPPDDRYVSAKLPALRRLIADCLGVYFEATAADSLAAPGAELAVAYELTARAGELPVRLAEVALGGATLRPDAPATNEAPLTGELTATVPARTANPYWLEGEATPGMYAAPGYDLRGLGENPPALTATAVLEVDGRAVPLQTPVQYKRTYPDRGETYRPLLVVPAAGIHFEEPVYLWPDAAPKSVTVTVTSFGGASAGEVALELPAGWRAEPASAPVTLSATGDKRAATFSVTPPSGVGQDVGAVRARFRTSAGGASGGDVYDRDVQIIRYPHIPEQAIVRRAEARAVRLDLAREGQRIGYIPGAGDAVPEALTAVGYRVDELGPADVTPAELARYDAVVLGIRAYNKTEWLPGVNDALLAYAKAGGTVVVQYNTNRRLDMDQYAPYPLTLSRDRVTVEEAPVEVIDADAPVLTRPNRITAADFEGWVQERGLYFPSEWADEYQPVLEIGDPGEDPSRGSLLVAPYGEGHYVYTGLSFFRELPAGVPGAYRLFVNLLEL